MIKFKWPGIGKLAVDVRGNMVARIMYKPSRRAIMKAIAQHDTLTIGGKNPAQNTLPPNGMKKSLSGRSEANTEE